jgi:hypothetical protein
VSQDALLVIGAELLDLHLASDAASDAEDAEVAASSPGIGVGAAPNNGTSYSGPAGLRLAKVSYVEAAATCHAVCST